MVIWDHWIFQTLKCWNQKPRNFETKKLWNHETKKLWNQETQKLWYQEASKLWNQETLKRRNEETKNDNQETNNPRSLANFLFTSKGSPSTPQDFSSPEFLTRINRDCFELLWIHNYIWLQIGKERLDGDRAIDTEQMVIVWRLFVTETDCLTIKPSNIG